MFVEEHPYQTIVWYKPFASAQQVCCFQLWKRFSHSVPRDRQVCDLCEISCSRGDAGYGQPLSCPWSRSREVPRWKISSNLRHRAPRYISSWMGSEPTDTQRDPSCRIYRIRQDVSVCCLRLLCFLQFMYLYIYISFLTGLSGVFQVKVCMSRTSDTSTLCKETSIYTQCIVH